MATAPPGPDLLTPLPIWILYVWFISEPIGSSPELVAALLVAVSFVLWNPQLLRGEGVIPQRSVNALPVLAAAITLYLLSRIPWMVKANGLSYFGSMCMINLGLLILLVGAFRFARAKTRFSASLGYHWLLFAWPASYGFPYLHEAI